MRAVILVLALLVAGCGDDGGDGGTETTGTQTRDSNATVPPVDLTVSTSGTYPLDPGFDPDRLEVSSGATVNLTFRNVDQNAIVVHDWVLEGVEGAATAPIGSGEEDTITFTAPAPGEYTYFCSVGDHRERGMEGTLVVT